MQNVDTYCDVGYVSFWDESYPYSNHELYDVWRYMIRRCYGKQPRETRFYKNKGTIVDDNWHNFSNFKNDYYKLEGYLKGAAQQLDKDILKTNVYGKYNCVLVSKELNLFLTHRKSCNSTNVVGVSIDAVRNKYLCQIKHNGRTLNLGRFELTNKGLMCASDVYWNKKISILNEFKSTTTDMIFNLILKELKTSKEFYHNQIQKEITNEN